MKNNLPSAGSESVEPKWIHLQTIIHIQFLWFIVVLKRSSHQFVLGTYLETDNENLRQAEMFK